MRHASPFVAAALWLLLAGLAGATEFAVPKQQIVGADKPIPLGELVTLSVSPPEKVANLVSTSYTWKVFDNQQEKRFAVDSEGNVFFGAGVKPKRLLVVVAVTHVYMVKDGEQVKQVATKTSLLTSPVVIGDTEPPPQPDEPQPKPDGEPTFDDGKYQLSKFAWESAKGKVNASGRAEAARALAGSFRGIASAVAAGTIKDAKDILKKTKDANDAALGRLDAVARWEAFSEALEEKLFGLYRSGSLKSPDDFATAWRELADGLDKVK